MEETHTEAVAQMCSVRKVLLEMLQYLQENACVRVSFVRDSGLGVFL